MADEGDLLYGREESRNPYAKAYDGPWSGHDPSGIKPGP